MNRLRSGATYGTTIAPAYWSVSFTTFPLHKVERGKWVATFDLLRGNTKSMVVYNPGLEYPAAYKDFEGLVKAGTANPFTGVSVVQTISANALSLSGLPANFILSRGDLVGLVQNNRYTLHRIVEDVVGNTSGVTPIFQVEPPIPTNFFTTAAVANLYRASVEVILDPSSISGDEESVIPVPITFSATSRAY